MNTALFLLLHARDWRVRRAAIRALSLLGERSVEAIPALWVNARFDSLEHARQEAAEAILTIRLAANRSELLLGGIRL